MSLLSSSQQHDTVGAYTVLNNDWGAGGLVIGKSFTQQISFDANDINNNVVMSWSYPDGEGVDGVYGYPEIIWGAQYGGFGPGTIAYADKVSDIKSLIVDYNIAISGQTSDFDVGIEIWTTNELPSQAGAFFTSEIMVMVHGWSADGLSSGPGTTYSDSALGLSGSGTAIEAIHDNQDNSGSPPHTFVTIDTTSDQLSGQINFATILDSLVEQGIVGESNYVAGVELGSEMLMGSGSLTVSSFFVSENFGPTVIGVSSNPGSGGTAGLGETVAIDLSLSDTPLLVSGLSTLKLSDGGTAVYNVAASTPASGVLEFDYSVSSGQHTADLTITGITVPGGGSITDLAGNAASLRLSSSQENLGLTINGIPPAVIAASLSPPVVGSGGSVIIRLRLSEAVTVSGAPALDLNDGGSASYVSGSGSTSLTFDYIPESEIMSALAITGINETGGTIKDAAGNELSTNSTFALKIAVNIDSWAHGSSGNFDTSADWTLGAPPTSGQEASISIGGGYTVSVGSGASVAVAALNIADKTATLLVTSGGSFTASAGGANVIANSGAIDVEDGSTLVLGGAVNNAGAIKLRAGNTMLLGGVVIDTGTVNLAGSTIIDAGAVLEAASGGTALLGGAISNSGTLFASGTHSLIDILNGATVAGGGGAEVGNGIIDIQNAGDDENVTFLSGDSGGLELGDTLTRPAAYGGAIIGFGANTHQFIDLVSVASNSKVAFAYTSVTASGGTLTVSSGGSTVASIVFSGSYTSANFHLTVGAGGTVEIIDPPVAASTVQSANLGLFGQYMAGRFVIAAGGQAGITISTTSQGDQPLLAHPHA
jgi:hypothetical protein